MQDGFDMTTGQSWPDITNSSKLWLKSAASIIQNDENSPQCSWWFRTWGIQAILESDIFQWSLGIVLVDIFGTLRRDSTCRFHVNKSTCEMSSLAFFFRCRIFHACKKAGAPLKLKDQIEASYCLELGLKRQDCIISLFDESPRSLLFFIPFPCEFFGPKFWNQGSK